jgi:hypothetical protein
MSSTVADATLLDEVLSEYDFGSRHERRIAAPPERVARAVEDFRVGGRASLLLRIRGIHLPPGPIGEVLRRSGFTVLAERPGHELVAGTNGRFWAVDELAHMEAPLDLAAFRAFDRPGSAQGAISVRLEPLDDGSTALSTETRVRCVDAAARRRFSAYWLLIKVFGGWLRRDFLRSIARAAEDAG